MRKRKKNARGRSRLILSGLLLLTSCSRVGFNPAPPTLDFLQRPPIQLEDDTLPPASPPTSNPIPTNPSPPLPSQIEKTGFCENNQSISSCLSCSTPTPPAPPAPSPSLSLKAQQLARVMSLSCPVPNKSDSQNYSNYPTERELLQRLESCGEREYPETPTSQLQGESIERLMASDGSFRQHVFGGRWYRPPYSDHFELYFGIETSEARKILCSGRQPAQSQVLGDLLTSEYWRDCRQSRDDCWTWKRDSQAQKRWQDVQTIRQGLRSCLDRPLPPPASLNPPPAPPRLCHWKSIEGPRALVESSWELWKKNFQKVSVENNQSCSNTDLPTGNSSWLKITGYFCP